MEPCDSEQNDTESDRKDERTAENLLFSVGKFVIHKVTEESVVEAVQAVTDEKRAELVEATKKKKVLDRLKERKLEEHTKAELKEEQDYIDDIAAQRFNRDKGAEPFL